MGTIRSHKMILNKIIVILFMFVVPYLPTFSEMTPLGMKVLGIFVGTIYGWITIDLLWPSLIGIIALGLSGIFDSLEACFSACFGTQTSLLILGSLFVCALVAATDLSLWIVRFMMNLRVAKKYPFIMVFFIFLAAWIVATLSHAIVAGVLVLSIYRSLAKAAHIPSQDPVNSFMLVGITLGCMFGDLTFPFRPISYAILNVYTAFSGSEIDFTRYMITCMPFLAFMLAAYTLFGKLFRVDISFLKEFSEKSEKPVATKKQKWTLFFLVMMLATMMIPSLTGESTNPVFQVVNMLGLGGLTVIWLLIMMFWEIDGKPLMNLQELSRNFEWGVYLCVCFLIPLANAISNEECGISATLSSLLSPILSNMSPMLFLISIVLLSIVLTNVLNNMIVAMLFITLLFSLPECMENLDVVAAVLSIMLASYVACATPAASPLNAFMYGQRDLVSFKNQILQGLKACVLLAVLIICIFYPFASFIFPG